MNFENWTFFKLQDKKGQFDKKKNHLLIIFLEPGHTDIN